MWSEWFPGNVCPHLGDYIEIEAMETLRRYRGIVIYVDNEHVVINNPVRQPDLKLNKWRLWKPSDNIERENARSKDILVRA